jgi:hypothetical protein
MATTLHLAIVLWMAMPFPYFISAGANTFTVPKLRDTGAVLGQISFILGMLCVIVMGLFYALLIPAALCGCVLALCSVMLFEWGRRTVIDRNFYAGLSGEVPGAVCGVAMAVHRFLAARPRMVPLAPASLCWREFAAKLSRLICQSLEGSA